MNIFRPLTCKWSELLRFAGKVALLLVGLAWVAGAPAQQFPSPPRPLRPFLEEFAAPGTVVLNKKVSIVTPRDKLPGFLALPDLPEALPAILLIHDQAGQGKWMGQNALDLAGIGYVVLVIDLHEHRKTSDPMPAEARARDLADLSEAIHWLRRRPEVIPARIGVVGWARAGEQALDLASATSLQACVICDGSVSAMHVSPARLRGTAVLGIVSCKNESRAREVRTLQKALAGAKVPHQIRFFEKAGEGFMDPGNTGTYIHEAAEHAWVEIYEFLGKYVEDAPLQPAPAKAKK